MLHRLSNTMTYYKLPTIVRRPSARCFICSVDLAKANYTLEHLIPQWMIEAFNLKRSTLTIGDHAVRYLDFLVPCCRPCNCYALSRIERSIKRSILGPDEVPTELPILDLALWSCKIIAGTQLYMRALAPDAAKQELTEERVDPSDICRYYLQMLRGDVTIIHRNLPFPFSFWLFRTKVPKDPAHGFDFQIAPKLNAIMLRAGHCSILCRADGGYLSLHGEHVFGPFRDKYLAPLHMAKLAALFFTLAERQAHNLLFVRTTHGGTQRLQYYPETFRVPFIDPGDNEDFEFYASWFLQPFSPAVLCYEPARSFLLDEGNRFVELDADVGL